MKPRAGLRPLSGQAAGLGPDARTAEAEARLRRAWDFIVGPHLADRTRMLSFRRGVLTIGCWDVAMIGSLRQAAETVWPQVQARLLEALRLRATAVQILPCDPPDPIPKPEPQAPLTFGALVDRLQGAGRRHRRS
ncbi:MAG TPA: DciA family protein [Holophagaceae bacterium]|nr:DciA family protein [Holophagaceae bacterium]